MKRLPGDVGSRRPKDRDLTRDLARREEIIRVEELDEFTPGARQSGISSPARSAATRAQDSRTRCGRDRCRGVAGAVVDDDRLDRLIGLRADARQRLGDPPLGIERRYDHRHEAADGVFATQSRVVWVRRPGAHESMSGQWRGSLPEPAGR